MMIIKLRNIGYKAITLSSIYQQDGFSFVLPSVLEIIAKGVLYGHPPDFEKSSIDLLLMSHELFPSPNAMDESATYLTMAPFYNWCTIMRLEMMEAVGALHEAARVNGVLKVTQLDLANGVVYLAMAN